MMVSGRWRGLKSLSLSRSRVSTDAATTQHFTREHHTEKKRISWRQALRAININQDCPPFESMSSLHYAKSCVLMDRLETI